MSEGPGDQTDGLPEWEGSERFWDARDKHAAGDTVGAFRAYSEIIGPTVREISDNEIPYVAAALAGAAGIVDASGATRDAVAAYNLAIRTIEQNESRLSRYSWIADSLPRLRARRDELAARTDSEPGPETGM